VLLPAFLAARLNTPSVPRFLIPLATAASGFLVPIALAPSHRSIYRRSLFPVHHAGIGVSFGFVFVLLFLG
jgi:hypothetical protein